MDWGMGRSAVGVEQRGFSLLEALCAIAIGILLLTIFVSIFLGTLERSRVDAAMREVVSDVRELRSQAITKGWQYRVVGYRDGSTGNHPNEYRVFGRRSSAVAWPNEDGPAFETATQMAGSWTNLAEKYPGVTVSSAASRFEVSFDSRGTAPGASAVTVTGHDGRTKTLTVSVTGSVKIE